LGALSRARTYARGGRLRNLPDCNGNWSRLDFNDFEVAARESAAAYLDGKLWGFIRHARITEAQAAEFWERMATLVAEFDQLPRAGKTVYGFAVGVYPTGHPTLPEGDEDKDARPRLGNER
jgi:hypothetical protein